MKKILSLVLAIAMLFSLCALAACGGNEDDNKTNSTPASQTASTEEKTELTTVTPGKLTMATNAYFQPYEFYEGDKIVGIDAEIAEAIAKKLGLELVINDMAFDSIITAVDQGSADFGLAGMTVTPDRLKEVDFSISYAKGVQSIIVKEGSAITCYDDLAAEGETYKVGVQLGTTGDIYASDEFGDRVNSFTTGNEAVNALLGGDVDCVIIDNEPAKSYVSSNEGLKILETSYVEENYAICVSKENEGLLASINKALDELTESGEIQKIIDKYITAE